MKTKYLAFAAAALMLASCSNDEDFVPQDDLKDTPITVTAGVEGMLTRAGYEGTSVLPETFYLTVIQAEGESQYNYHNMVMEKTAGENKYTPIDNMFWNEANRSPFVSAYTIEGTTFKVQTDQSSEPNVIASDLLGAVKKSGETSGDVTITEDNIAINFRHLLCKLDVTFSWGTEFSTENKTIKSVVYSGFGISATLNREDGAITADETPTDITAYMNGTTSEAIFAPYVGATSKIVITTTIDGVDRIFSIGVKAPADGFVSGKCYTMGVKIGGTVAEISRVNVTPWTGQDIPNVDTEELPSDTYDATTMTAKQLNVAVAKALAYGHTNISVNLAADAGEEMFKAITTALATDGIEPGSLDLTISGVKTVPERAFDGDRYQNENYEAMAVLKSVTLPDATQLDDFAFYYCLNMTRFAAPNVVTMGQYALYGSEKLTEVHLPSLQSCGIYALGALEELKAISLPSLTTLAENLFSSCSALETVNTPNVTVVIKFPFRDCESLTKVTLGAVETVYNHNNTIGGLFEYCIPGNIDLVLSSEQKVMTYDKISYRWDATETSYNGSTDHQNNSFVGYTLKSITFAE